MSTYYGVTITRASKAPAHLDSSFAPGWSASCPDCGWETWGSYQSHVRAQIKDHRVQNWPPCEVPS